MKASKLAQELRERQYAQGIVPRELIDMLPDDAIIDSYITCSGCGQKQVNEAQLPIAIKKARNADHFIQIINRLSQNHTHNFSEN
jgi:hypothetical protein